MRGVLVAVVLAGLTGWNPVVSAQESRTSKSPSTFRASPPQVHLSGPRAVWRLLVDEISADGSSRDATLRATFRSSDPALLSVDADGMLRAVADGEATVEATMDGQPLSIPVTVRGAHQDREFHFENDILPILTRYGCNTSGCHGKAEGQNGFKLSVFGFDPDADHAALTQESRGRRVFPSEPARSLLLGKAAGTVPHGGGVRLASQSREYQTLSDWIAAGLPRGSADAPRIVSLSLFPSERTLTPGARQPLRVVARTSDDRDIDVTLLAGYHTNNEALATVDDLGVVTTGNAAGDVAIMASYLGAVAVFRGLVPRVGSEPPVVRTGTLTRVDELVQAKLTKLKIAPSPTCSDADYLRRTTLDIVGRIPTPEEAREFLADSAPDKRAKWVERLLALPDYADYQALKWSDILRVERQALGHKRAYAYYRWIRDSFAENKPYDQFCRELLTATGDERDAPQGALFKVVTQPGDLAGATSQVFLGVRIDCAKCHHHPFDRWSQTDYLGMQGFFTQVQFKSVGGVELLLAQAEAASTHPRTGVRVYAHPLGAPLPEQDPAGDRRVELARWMTAAENPWFARNLANRMWAHYLGRGLVDPVDDVRATNPPSNPELLDELARELVSSSFDVRHLIRVITRSEAYQRSSEPNDSNRQDEQNFSRALLKRLDAEVLLDAVSDATGVADKFGGTPSGVRAVQLWDSQSSHEFLKLFGRPTRQSVCECERSAEPSTSQVLHLLNSPALHAKLAHESGRLASLVNTQPEDGTLTDEIYLAFVSRLPTEAERTAATSYFARQPDRRRAAEDLAWALLNSTEFLFNH